ncbi:MAG: hypothetical protein HY044_01505 [Candidatus Woesebacteria bacterium]|nr:MAG: hypothetical protein HY044_01505 [Candidatus Woesebacteria bacterium]
MVKKNLGNLPSNLMIGLLAASIAILALVIALRFQNIKTAFSAGGFDQFGYNYQARIFSGLADGVDKNLDGKVWGDPTYAKDHLVMKWSKAWNDARFNGASWTPDAYEDNEWNGKVPGGSGEVWHYKIVWVGPELEKSQYWRTGGYAIWGQFEVIMDQGSVANEHFWNAHSSPNGYGIY